MSITKNFQKDAYMRDDNNGIAEDIKATLAIFPRLRKCKDQLAETMSSGE